MYHEWGDGWPYWKDLHRAETYIYDFVKRWSRCTLLSKEKYGAIRYEWVFPPYGHIYFKNKLIRYWNLSWLYKKWELFGWWVCGIAIKKAIKRWPYLEDELCCHFYAPTKFGRELNAKYWEPCDD